MQSVIPVEMQYVIYALAVWRLTHLLVAEDGPWNVVFRLRVFLGNSMAGRTMDCFYCASMWIAIPFALLFADHWVFGLISWLSFSGFASLLEQATSHSFKNKNND